MVLRAVWATAFAALAFAGVAQAADPTLEVTDLGQPAAPVEIGQAPLLVASTGSCQRAFTLAAAGECPPGAWPGFGGSWAPKEDVAGGDTLRLRFSGSVAAVRVASTSNYPPGLTDPDGMPVLNFDAMPETAASPTDDPGVWTVALPALDARAVGEGLTFSVVADDGSGSHDYPFGIHSPRWADEEAKCGTAYYSAGSAQRLCGELVKPRPAPVLAVLGATYDGRLLKLRLQVPSAGSLRIGLPSKCRRRKGSACRRRTWVRRRFAERGEATLRSVVALRLGAGRTVRAPMRFEGAAGTAVGILVFRVHGVRR